MTSSLRVAGLTASCISSAAYSITWRRLGFCEWLSREPANIAMSSTELNDYILARLRDRKIEVNNQFNPKASSVKRGRT